MAKKSIPSHFRSAFDEAETAIRFLTIDSKEKYIAHGYTSGKNIHLREYVYGALYNYRL